MDMNTFMNGIDPCLFPDWAFFLAEYRRLKTSFLEMENRIPALINAAVSGVVEQNDDTIVYNMDGREVTAKMGKPASFPLLKSYILHNDDNAATIVQGGCFDPVTNKYVIYVKQGATSYGKLYIIDVSGDKPVITRKVDAFDGGHGNDMSYDAINNKILLCTNGEGSHITQIIVINPVTYQVDSYINLGLEVTAIATDTVNNLYYVYVGGSGMLYAFNRNWERVQVDGAPMQTHLTPYTTISPTALLQSAIVKDGQFYLLFSDTSDSGIFHFVAYNVVTGAILKTWTAKGQFHKDEVEGCDYANGKLFVHGNSPKGSGLNNILFNVYAENNGSTDITPDIFSSGENIPAGSNIDGYITPGKYYVTSASDAQNITGVPVVNAGGTLLVMFAAYDHVQQIYIASTNNIFYRHRSGLGDSATWSGWKTVDISMSPGTSITLNHLIAPGYITNNKSDVYATISLSGIVTATAATLTSNTNLFVKATHGNLFGSALAISHFPIHTLEVLAPGILRLHFNKASGDDWSAVTNNSPVMVEINGGISFT